jgi:molecular chaperone HtpG
MQYHRAATPSKQREGEDDMREQFRVDLRGLVEVLSHHLYSSERVYLRELVQNARDAVAARVEFGDDIAGLIEIEPAWGTDPLIVRDNGYRAHRRDMRTLLSMIGSTSKRDDFAMARRDFLGQFGIGLLSGFLVADSIEVLSRSARTPDAPTLRWVGSSDGTFTITESASPLPEPGTEVRLHPRYRAYRWCEHDSVVEFASDFAELLDVAVRIRDTVVSQKVPPWKLTTDEQLAWCRERFGFEAMGIIPLESTSADVTGLAFVLPYTARPGYRTGDRIYSKGMLVADRNDLIVPRWAFFCRAVIDAGELPLTAAREGLQESRALQFARKRIGFRLLSELILVHGMYPDVFHEIIALHAEGAEGAGGARVRRSRPAAVHAALRHDRGRSHHPAAHREPPVPFPTSRTPTPTTRSATVAAHAGVLLVDASGVHEAELLQLVDDATPAHFREVTAHDVIALADPVAPRRPAIGGARRQGRPGAARRARVRAGGELRAGGPARAVVARRRALLRRRPGGARAQRRVHRGEAAARHPGGGRHRGAAARALRDGPAARPRPAHGRPRRTSSVRPSPR